MNRFVNSISANQNLLLILAGFAVGQGSLFVCQSYLAVTGNLALLGEFGLGFSVLVFMSLLIDAGSVQVLALKVIESREDDAEPDDSWLAWYSASVAVRFVIFVVSIVGVSVYCLTFVGRGSFFFAYFFACVPGLLFSSVGMAGILDGYGRSGLGGFSTCFPLCCTALGLAVIKEWAGASSQGLVVGAGFTIGCFLTLFFQYICLKRLSIPIRLVHVTGSHVRTTFGIMLQMIAAFIPGQFYFRGQLALAAVSFTPDVIGALVYAKQVTSSLVQVCNFIRRTEFPRLIVCARAGVSLVRGIFVIQWRSALVTSAVALGGALVFAVAWLVDRANLVAMMLFFYFLVLITDSFTQSISQWLFANENFKSNGLARWFCSSIGLFVSALLIGNLGVLSFFVADVVSHLAFAVLVFALISRVDYRGKPLT